MHDLYFSRTKINQIKSESHFIIWVKDFSQKNVNNFTGYRLELQINVVKRKVNEQKYWLNSSFREAQLGTK